MICVCPSGSGRHWMPHERARRRCASVVVSASHARGVVDVGARLEATLARLSASRIRHASALIGRRALQAGAARLTGCSKFTSEVITRR